MKHRRAGSWKPGVLAGPWHPSNLDVRAKRSVLGQSQLYRGFQASWDNMRLSHKTKGNSSNTLHAGRQAVLLSTAYRSSEHQSISCACTEVTDTSLLCRERPTLSVWSKARTNSPGYPLTCMHTQINECDF